MTEYAGGRFSTHKHYILTLSWRTSTLALRFFLLMNCTTPKRLTIYHTETGEPFTMFVPCDKCYACQCRKRGELALRCKFELESKRTKSAHFVTLTYDNKHLPCEHVDLFERQFLIKLQMAKRVKSRNWSDFLLNPDHISKFLRKIQPIIKDLSLKREPDFLTNEKIKENRLLRYVLTGEYGDLTHRQRPHYHALLYFPFLINKSDLQIILDKCWPYGAVDIGDDFRSDCVNYVAKHQCKDCEGTEFQQKVSPIFKRQSRYKGGIGVNDMVESPQVLAAFYNEDPTQRCQDLEQGQFIYKVGIPRAVRKKLHPDIRSPVELANLEISSNYTFMKFKHQYLLDFPDLKYFIEGDEITDSFTKIIIHSYGQDQKIKETHKKKKLMQAIQKVEHNNNLIDLK